MPNADPRIVFSTWCDPGWTQMTQLAGMQASGIALGDGDDSERPTLLITNFAAGTVINGHAHDADLVDAIVAGSLIRDGVTYSVGVVRYVPRGTFYNRAVAGPTGVTMLEFYSRRAGATASYENPEDAPPSDVLAKAKANLDLAIRTPGQSSD